MRESSPRRYPRTARVNHVVQEVVADELERIDDDRLGMMTVTGVEVDPDLRHATVWLSSLSSETQEALGQHRVRLQGAIGRQMRMKRTPELRFRADPAVETGQRVEDILRGLEEDRD
ncbi:MAG: 30S ribosome-binding factor RbfA [Acidimicrobiia bacterium]|nr:30S ribosome-binding factor RbfA [Acidimicrobiia bacterium]MBV8985550.1 30S ribosome-binding factor RbfA [Acidimicrobiia bacterium]MBV9042808.1 30S ribosome-binding factor RbfA [Acidimicrobiia bacterium]